MLSQQGLNAICATLKVVFRVKNCIENRSKISFKPLWGELFVKALHPLNACPFSVSIWVLLGFMDTTFAKTHRHLLTDLE